MAHNTNDSLISTEEHLSNFNKIFKYYKRRSSPPDLSLVLDVSNPKVWEQYEIQKLPLNAVIKEDSHVLGLKPLSSLSLLKFKRKPGLLFIPNPFTPEGQQKWVSQCLEEYTRSPPFKLNLSAHHGWNKGKETYQWWELCKKEDTQNTNLRNILRWSTLGYHHNWDTKVYSEDDRSIFPPELSRLSQFLTEAAGFPNFNAEAAIVNFYHMNSTLAGHTDHSEQDHSAPLLSLSFGQSAIFLIGGQEKNEIPMALLVQSGDVIIMSGASRLSYHGVPRILPASSDHPWGMNNSDEWTPCHNYLCSSRINLNIRQVLPAGKKSLVDSF